MKNTLLVSDDLIKDRTSIHTNIDAKLIYPDIKACQDMFIAPILGSALFLKLQLLIEQNTISDAANADYKLLLDEYIADALMYYVVAQLPITMSYQIWNKGVVRKLGQDTELPSKTELDAVSDIYKNRAEFYANRLKLFVIQYAPTKYKEYLNPGSTIDTIIPKQESFTMPVYLGDEQSNPFCNRGRFNGQPYTE